MVTSKDVWLPSRFKASLAKRGLRLSDVWRALQRDLGDDAPQKSTVYKWALPKSGGPQRRAWRRALACVLRKRRKRVA